MSFQQRLIKQQNINTNYMFRFNVLLKHFWKKCIKQLLQFIMQQFNNHTLYIYYMKAWVDMKA